MFLGSCRPRPGRGLNRTAPGSNDVYRERRWRAVYCELVVRRPVRSRSLPCRTSRPLSSSLTTTSQCANGWSCQPAPQGGSPKPYASAQEFLSRARATVPCCLVLDVTLPGLNGLELQQQLAERKDMPIIFITGHGDVPMSVQAMKAGAVEFLTKPFKDDVLLDAIRGAIERSRVALRLDSEMRALRTCYESLTPREREVMPLVVSGMLNKQVGGELGISEITVKAQWR
jgi:FixJ family two-component response regulator